MESSKSSWIDMVTDSAAGLVPDNRDTGPGGPGNFSRAATLPRRACHDDHVKAAVHRFADRIGDRGLRRAALVGGIVAVACVAGTLVLHWELTRRVDVDPVYASDLVLGSVWPVAGVVVVYQQPRNRCGWLLVGTGLMSVYLLLGQYSVWSAKVTPLPGSAVADWISMFGFGVYFIVLPLLTLIFPDGRVRSRPEKALAVSALTAAGGAICARMVVPGPADVDGSIRNPIGIDALEPLNYVTLVSSFYCLAVATPLAVIALVVRTRRAVGVQRAQLQWFMVGGIVMACALIGALLLRDNALGNAAFVVALLSLPVAVVLATLRYRLLDAEFALSRSIVLVLVVAVVATSGGLVLWQIDPDIAGSRAGIALVVVCVLSAFAVRAVLQRVIDDLWFPQLRGTRTLAPRISEAVSLSTEPRAALADLISALRSELRMPYVAFDGAIRTEVGHRPERVVTIEAIAMGRRVGQLEVAPRRAGDGFSDAERTLLEQAAAHGAMMAYAASLVAETEDSRARIVAAREEERRRLRNDLHDGVGPSLAGIALQMDALAHTLRRSGDIEYAENADSIRDRVRETVAQVRAVSHGLRPPVLDQLGLAEALRQLVDGLGMVEGVVQLDDMGELPAAAEVATYSIAAEAVTNVVHHSAASRVRIDVECDGQYLELRVSDNGRGLPGRPRPGVGLTSMRQRAAEVGGRVEHLAAQGGGTVVRLVLPVTSLPGQGKVASL
ncbi:sensor histidine kinase [Williamsia limnetica]|nr:sensor histidine kinase [Williamsia limnetica]